MEGEEPPQEKKITRPKFERRSSWCVNNGSSDPSPVKSVAKERRLLTQPTAQLSPLSPTARPAKKLQRRGTCPSDLGIIGGWAEAECIKKDQSFSGGGSSQLISQNVALRRRFWMEARIDFQERKAALPSKTPPDLLRLAMEHTRSKVKGLLMRAKVVKAFRSYSVEQQELREAEAKAAQLALESELERVAVSDDSDTEDDERAKEEQEKRNKEMIAQIRLRHLVKVEPLVIDARLKLQQLQELVAAHKDDLESISSQMAETKRSMQDVLTRFEQHVKNEDLGVSVHTKFLEINDMMSQLCKDIEDGDSLTIMQSITSSMQATQHVGQAVTSEVSNCYGVLGKKPELTEKKDVEKKDTVTQKKASSKEKVKEAVSALSRLKRVAKKVGVVSSMCKERKVEAEKEEVVVEKEEMENEKQKVVVEKENVETEKEKAVVEKENVGKGKAKVVLDKDNLKSLRVKIVVEKENAENEKAKVPKRSSQARRTASILQLASQKKTHRALLRDVGSKVRQAITVLKEETAMSAPPPAAHEDVAPSHEDATPGHEYAASGRNLAKRRWKESVNDMASARKELEQEIQNLEGTHDAHLEDVDDEKVQLALSNIVLDMEERLEHHSDTLGDTLQEFIHAHQEIQPDPREAMDSSDDIQPKTGEDSETHADPESTQVSEPECIPATPELSDDADDACSEKSLGFDSESSLGLQSKPCETEVSSSNGESTVHACTPKLPPITPRRISCPGTCAAVGAGTITGFCVGFLKSMLKPEKESSEDVGQATGQDADEAIASGRRHSMPVGRSLCPAQRFARSGQCLVEEKSPSLDSVPDIKLPEERKRQSRVFSKGSAESSTSTSSSISTAASVKHRDQEPIRISNNRATESVSGSPLMNAWDKTLPQLPMEQPQTKKSPNRAHRRLSDIGRVSDPLESENCTTTEALPKTKIKNIGLQGQDISLEGKVPLSQNFLGLEISPPGVQRQAKRHDNFKSRLRERFAPAL